MRGTILVLAGVASTLLLIYYWVFYMPGSSEGIATGANPAGIDALRRHIQTLAIDIGERHAGRPGSLDLTADYILERFQQSGWKVSTQSYDAYGQTFRNITAESLGGSEEILIVGAHYDSVPGSPGANDNATGVAALLELLARNRDRRFPRTVRFVAFTNEEHPHSGTPAMGSLVYARAVRDKNENIVGMISLETIGYYTDQPQSQKYPSILGWFYPDRGNFIAFVGNLRSRRLVRAAISSFRRYASIASEGMAAPELLKDMSRSDHASFWRYGYAAIMVTDTAPFRYPYYHTRWDVPDKIDVVRLGHTVHGLNHMIRELAGSAL